MTEVATIPNAHFGGGTGPIFLDRLACVGNEDTILECSHARLHLCSHTDDVSVRCLGKKIIS